MPNTKAVISGLTLASTLLICSIDWTSALDEDAERYLSRLGYGQTGGGLGALVGSRDDVFSQMLRRFQRKWRQFGLQETGEMDTKTQDLLDKDRCGNKDYDDDAESYMPDIVKRRKRYAVSGAVWSTTDLTWDISTYPPSNTQQYLTNTEIDNILQKALNYWAAVTPLRFTRLRAPSSNPSQYRTRSYHFDVRFVSYSHSTFSSDPAFDGPGSTLAHAFFPTRHTIGGDAHFDNDETFTDGVNFGTNLLQVAIHEFGHSLGLGHSDRPDSIMAPFYRRYTPNPELDIDDIEGIQYLYGPNPDLPSTTPDGISTRKTTTPDKEPEVDPSPPPGEIPRPCEITTDFDAITSDREGNSYGFQGDYYVKFLPKANGIYDGYPRLISDDWENLPSNIDASIYFDNYLTSSGRRHPLTFFFKGCNIYYYYDQVFQGQADIRLIWPGMPCNIDAGFVWKRNGKTYIFKGDQYYRLSAEQGNGPVDDKYPRSINVWGQNSDEFPVRLSAAYISPSNNKLYLFDGEEYYRFDDTRFEVDTRTSLPYPRPVKQWWLGCAQQGNIEQEMEHEDADDGLVHIGSDDDDDNNNDKVGDVNAAIAYQSTLRTLLLSLILTGLCMFLH